MDERERGRGRAAGEAAAAQVEDGMRVGLGTGRAAAAGIRALGERVAGGLRCTRGADLARQRGAGAGAGHPAWSACASRLDLAFDGADAVDPGGLVVKGAGGALVRERLVADAAARFLVLVDAPKLVGSLDEWGVLPVAVVPFGAARVARTSSPTSTRAGAPAAATTAWRILDLRVPAGRRLARRGRPGAGALPGVVDHGLFRASLRPRPGGAPRRHLGATRRGPGRAAATIAGVPPPSLTLARAGGHAVAAPRAAAAGPACPARSCCACVPTRWPSSARAARAASP